MKKEKTGRKFKKREKIQLALITLVVLIASAAAIMLLTPAFDIKEIEVSGNVVLKDEDIIRAGGLVKGVNIFSISIGEVEENLKSKETIKSVKVKRTLPSTITVTIVEEVGVAYLTSEEGFIEITAEGRCIKVSDGSETTKDGVKVTTPPQLPKITGMNNVKYKVGKTITAENERQLDALLLCLKEFAKRGCYRNMLEIDVSDTSDIKFYYKNKTLCVFIGRAENLDSKMDRFDATYRNVEEKTPHGVAPSGDIILKYDDPIYRPKEETAENTGTNK